LKTGNCRLVVSVTGGTMSVLQHEALRWGDWVVSARLSTTHCQDKDSTISTNGRL